METLMTLPPFMQHARLSLEKHLNQFKCAAQQPAYLQRRTVLLHIYAGILMSNIPDILLCSGSLGLVSPPGYL